MKFTEIETKYQAQEISIKDFIAACETLNPDRRLDVGSYDHYYRREDGAALRYREGKSPELTVKRKLQIQNNFVRREVNLKVEPGTTREMIEEFASIQGYDHDFTIFKSCVIFFWENHNVVYYVVHDDRMEEKARFVEIEMNESYEWESEESAWLELKRIEKQFLSIGLSPARRMRRSLQEIFTTA